MKIAILSNDKDLYSTNRLLEAGVQKGFEVECIDPMKCIIELEKKKPAIFYKGQFLSGISAIIPRIGTSNAFYGTAVVSQFEMMKVFTTVDSVGLVRTQDKLRSYQVLINAGLGLPKTIFTNYSKDVSHVIDAVGGEPVVIKLLEGTQGLGVVLAETKQAATSVLEAFNGLKARVIVQEYIKESEGSDLRIFVVGENVVGAILRKSEDGEFRSSLKKSPIIEPVELTEEEETAAIKAARALSLGVAGVDMLRSERGPLILEVDACPRLKEIEEATGTDIAGLIFKYIRQNAELD